MSMTSNRWLPRSPLPGVEFARYDEFDHDAKGITARAGGERVAWFQDPDGNTFAIEADARQP